MKPAENNKLFEGDWLIILDGTPEDEVIISDIGKADKDKGKVKWKKIGREGMCIVNHEGQFMYMKRELTDTLPPTYRIYLGFVFGDENVANMFGKFADIDASGVISNNGDMVGNKPPR
ncbi:MAG TPA: hypothetical protein VNO70_10540 [Blastocatellia bacterium]|nr:hypothetical protein [Blastocatellia bacterium]